MSSRVRFVWRLEGSFAKRRKKKSHPCHSSHSNPVINRNGADEVQTKMRKKSCLVQSWADNQGNSHGTSRQASLKNQNIE